MADSDTSSKKSMFRTGVGVALNALLLAAGLWAASSTSGSRTAFPTRPIKLVVPFNAGGGTDTFARIMKKAIDDNRLLPQPLAIINVGGGGATIGSRRVKDAKPDGYTMLILHDAIFTAKYSGTVDYGPEAFRPVAATGEVGMVIAVRDDSPYQNLADLMRDARRRPKQVNFGANLGAMTHYAGLELETAWPGSDFQFSQVGGGADRYADLKGGHIDVTGFSIEEFVRFREGGLRGLAFFGKEPHPAAPDVPPARARDGKPLSNTNTFYWWVPRGTPDNRVRFLANVLEQAMQSAYVQKKLAEIKCDPVFLRGRSLHRHLQQTSKRYAAITPPEPANLPNFPALTLGALLCTLVAVAAHEFRRRSGRVAGVLANREASGSGDAPGSSRFPARRGLPSSSTAATRTSQTSAGPRWRVGLVTVSFLLTVAYVSSMATGRIDFRVATIAYVMLLGTLLSRLNWQRLPSIGIIAQSLAFGLHFSLTQLFEVDLP